MNWLPVSYYVILFVVCIAVACLCASRNKDGRYDVGGRGGSGSPFCPTSDGPIVPILVRKKFKKKQKEQHITICL